MISVLLPKSLKLTGISSPRNNILLNAGTLDTAFSLSNSSLKTSYRPLTAAIVRAVSFLRQDQQELVSVFSFSNGRSSGTNYELPVSAAFMSAVRPNLFWIPRSRGNRSLKRLRLSLATAIISAVSQFSSKLPASTKFRVKRGQFWVWTASNQDWVWPDFDIIKKI